MHCKPVYIYHLPMDYRQPEVTQVSEEETFAKIVMGKADISEFDTFVENWKNQGGDQILKEINDELSK